MFIIIKGVVCDPDLDLLAEILGVLDRQLASIPSDGNESWDADALGYFDRGEHITGLGFVACQAYMTATYGFLHISKSRALAVGPSHPTGLGVVEIVNHAANYWKHHEAWHLDRSPDHADRIRAAFDAVEAAGFPVGEDYPLSGILAALVDPAPAAFKPLVATLESWRDDLRGTTR